MTMSDVAERAQTARDLRDQLGSLDRQDEEEIVFKDMSRRSVRVPLYSVINGEMLMIPRHLIQMVIQKKLPDGRYMFTAKKEEAPPFIQGTHKCFLHPESPERPILNDIGLGGTVCMSAKLASAYSKRIHAMHRHKSEWAAYQDYINEHKELEVNQRQIDQIEAIRTLAARAAGIEASVEKPAGIFPRRGRPPSVTTCKSCGVTITGKLADHRC